MRLDIYLATYWPEHSRSQWQKLLKNQHVKVNGQVQTSPKLDLGEDDEVTVDLPKKTDFSQATLPIIFEDENVIVINKPAGILTHSKGQPLDEFTVGEFMKSRTSDKPESNRPGIVHRLDRATSGVIICAKNPQTHSFLQRQFSERNVKKHYVAVVSKAPKQSAALIKLPIERNPKKPQTFRVGGQGKPAETEYKLKKVLKNGQALIDLYPKTGRTHQLRVHMAYLGCPIVGDALYGGPSNDHMLLHAKDLEITIPGGTRKIFEAIEPEYFNIES